MRVTMINVAAELKNVSQDKQIKKKKGEIKTKK